MPTDSKVSVTFWSSVEYGAFVKGLLRELGKKGIPARQGFFLSQQSYRAPRGRFGRIGLRVQMYGLYPLKLILRQLFDRRSGVDVVCTNTFYAPLICALFRPRKRPVVHLVYDLFPDALYIGHGKKPKRIHRCVDKLVRMTFDRCSANVFLGEQLLIHAEKRFGQIPHAHVIPVGADASVFGAKSPPLRSGDPVRFLYCGNMGFLHDAETLAEGIRRSLEAGPTEPKASFRICASGARISKFRANMERFSSNPNRTPSPPDNISLRIEGSLGDADWVAAMAEADIALVAMVPDAGKVVMPSKTYSAMSAGQAILAIAPEDSDLTDLIREHDCGWRVDPGDAEGFAAAVQAICNDRDGVTQKRENALRAARKKYDVAVIAEQWVEVLERRDEG